MFIYVFDPAARDQLLQAGFVMLKADERNEIWVFAKNDVQNFDLERMDFSYLTSDTLTF